MSLGGLYFCKNVLANNWIKPCFRGYLSELLT